MRGIAARYRVEPVPTMRGIRILKEHSATLVGQPDAFQDYVAEAEREGSEDFPLHRWTRATIDDSAKRRRHEKAFALRVAGEEVYARGMADALEAALRPLVGSGLVERVSRHDTDPANNLAMPSEYRP